MFPLSITITTREHNKLFHANKTTFRLGENSHADMTATEFAARYLLLTNTNTNININTNTNTNYFQIQIIMNLHGNTTAKEFTFKAIIENLLNQLK